MCRLGNEFLENDGIRTRHQHRNKSIPQRRRQEASQYPTMKNILAVLITAFLVMLSVASATAAEIVYFYAHRAPVSNGSNDVINFSESGINLPGHLQEVKKFQQGLPYVSNPADRKAVVLVPETGELNSKWLMSVPKSAPVGLWEANIEADIGSIGTATTLSYFIKIDTTGGAVHQALRLDSNVARWSGVYPLRDGTGILGTNDRRKWIVGPGPDMVLGTEDDLTTSDPDQKIVAATYDGFQIRFQLPSNDEAGVTAIRDAVEQLPFWIRMSFDGLVTDQGATVVGDAYFLGAPLVEPMVVLEDGKAVVTNPRSYICYAAETSTSLQDSSWQPYLGPVTQTSNGLEFNFVIDEDRKFFRLNYGYCRPDTGLAVAAKSRLPASKRKALELLNKLAR